MQVPEFTSGEPPKAEDFVALVNAVRALWNAPLRHGTPYRRTVRHMHYFCVSGTSIARVTDNGSLSARVAEDVDTRNGRIRFVPGCTIVGIELEMQKHPSAVIGLHTQADGAAAAAVAWLADAELADSALEGEGLYHGERQCGALLPAAGVRGQRQTLTRMWSMPQKPLWAEVERRAPAFQGNMVLLPGGAFLQTLTLGAWYYTSEEGGMAAHVPWRFVGHLDRFGQLHIRFAQN